MSPNPSQDDRFQLRVISGADVGKTHPLRPSSPSYVGRSPSAEFYIHDAFVPPNRFRVTWAGGKGYQLDVFPHVTSLSLNGRTCEPGLFALADGDVIQLGRTSLVFERLPAESPPAPAGG